MKWKLEIRNEVIGKNGIRIEIEFFQNGNNNDEHRHRLKVKAPFTLDVQSEDVIADSAVATSCCMGDNR